MKMKLLIIPIIFIACKSDYKTEKITAQKLQVKNISYANAQDFKLEVYDFNGLQQFLNKKDNKTYVINFWATWCKPCVKELPEFERLNQQYKDKNVVVILVSLDFPHLYEKKLKPFIIENKLKCHVVALDDVDMDTWIPKVNNSWSGAIPATIIYKNDERRFYEQSFTYELLENEVKQFLK